MIIFAFSFDPATGECAFAGNISLMDAPQILQQIIVETVVKQALEAKDKSEKAAKDGAVA